MDSGCIENPKNAYTHFLDMTQSSNSFLHSLPAHRDVPQLLIRSSESLGSSSQRSTSQGRFHICFIVLRGYLAISSWDDDASDLQHWTIRPCGSYGATTARARIPVGAAMHRGIVGCWGLRELPVVVYSKGVALGRGPTRLCVADASPPLEFGETVDCRSRVHLSSLEEVVLLVVRLDMRKGSTVCG